MPTYEYYCEKCDIAKEVFHGMTEDPEVLCDTCENKMKKLVSGGTGVIYKGVGWASKGTATASKPRKFRETRIGVPEVMKDVVSDDVKKRANEIKRGD